MPPSKMTAATNWSSTVARWSSTECPPISSSPSHSTRTFTPSSPSSARSSAACSSAKKLPLSSDTPRPYSQPSRTCGLKRRRPPQGQVARRLHVVVAVDEHGRRSATGGRDQRVDQRVSVGLATVPPPTMRAASQSAAWRSSGACWPSLDTDSIASSSLSSSSWGGSVRAAGVLATGDVDQRQHRQDRGDAERDHEDGVDGVVVAGRGVGSGCGGGPGDGGQRQRHTRTKSGAR